MNTNLTEFSRQIRAEAASWVTRLHGPDRNADVEAGLKRWLAQDPAHAKAFELATEVWQETAELPADLPKRTLPADRTGLRSRLRPVLASAATIGVGAVGLFLYVHFIAETTFTTGVGEQRTVTLSDGTRVELNTRSALTVKYSERMRQVILKGGEAYFDVATNKERPFIVVAGGREVIALGTEFLVRRDADEITVTLLEGRVAVAPAIEAEAQRKAGSDVLVLQPGQRLRLADISPPVLDLPSMEKVTAWQRGQVIFEDTPLAEAMAEFNRYNATRIELESDELARIRVGGTFRVGDVSSFAHAVADSHALEVIDRGQRVLLIRVKNPTP